MFVSLYSSIFVVLFTTNNPLLILSITPSIFTDNINENFETEIPITHDKSTNSNLDAVLSDRNPEAYQDCTNILINKTKERNILLEYNYYEGYYLCPR